MKKKSNNNSVTKTINHHWNNITVQTMLFLLKIMNGKLTNIKEENKKKSENLIL
jgi:hypothetical protein